MTETDIFKALGDPLRLKIVKRLSHGSPYTLGDITKGLGVSRQGARKQIQVLASAHVVRLKPAGRQVMISLNEHSLHTAKKFITHLENQWDKRLTRLKKLF